MFREWANPCRIEYIDGGAYTVCAVHGDNMTPECAFYEDDTVVDGEEVLA